MPSSSARGSRVGTRRNSAPPARGACRDNVLTCTHPMMAAMYVLSVISHTHLILVMCAVVQLMQARAVSCSSRFVVR